MIDVRADRMAFGIRIDQPLDCKIQGVRTIEGEDKMFGPFAVKQSIKPPAAFAYQIARLDCLGIRSPPGNGAELDGIGAIAS